MKSFITVYTVALALFVSTSSASPKVQRRTVNCRSAKDSATVAAVSSTSTPLGTAVSAAASSSVVLASAPFVNTTSTIKCNTRPTGKAGGSKVGKGRAGSKSSSYGGTGNDKGVASGSDSGSGTAEAADPASGSASTGGDSGSSGSESSVSSATTAASTTTSPASTTSSSSTTGGGRGGRGGQGGRGSKGGKGGKGGSGIIQNCGGPGIATPPFTNSTSTTSNSTDSSLLLLAANVQNGSTSTGLDEGAIEKGQSASDTDNANFINHCTGKTLTNGLQVKTGSCNGVVMGDIPASTNMISSIITFPLPGTLSNLQSNTSFNITLQVVGLVAGTFTNPQTTYYAAPQTLSGGSIVGHTHVTVQSLGDNLATVTPPDPAAFAFFKGINDKGDGNGGLQAVVAGGLPPGNYRVCTMSSAANHQPVLMPVAQRGAQDDCQKFTVK